MLGGDLEASQGTMAPATIGGKSAFVWTQSHDEKSYLYVRGDTLFGLNSLSDAQADTVFAALP